MQKLKIQDYGRHRDSFVLIVAALTVPFDYMNIGTEFHVFDITIRFSAILVTHHYLMMHSSYDSLNYRFPKRHTITK